MHLDIPRVEALHLSHRSHSIRLPLHGSIPFRSIVCNLRVLLLQELRGGSWRAETWNFVSARHGFQFPCETNSVWDQPESSRSSALHLWAFKNPSAQILIAHQRSRLTTKSISLVKRLEFWLQHMPSAAAQKRHCCALPERPRVPLKLLRPFQSR